MKKLKTMITFLGLNLYTWGGILAIFATYFLIQKGAVENAKQNFSDVQTTITLSKEELIKHIDSLDGSSKVEIIKRLRPEFDKVINEVGLSKEQVIEHAKKLDRESRRLLFNKLSPEFNEIVNLLKSQPETIIDEVLKEFNPKLQQIEWKAEKERIINTYRVYSRQSVFGSEKEPQYGEAGSLQNLYLPMWKVIDQNNRPYPKIDSITIRLINNVIKEYPKFPFGFFCKSYINRTISKPWKEDALEAKRILEITSKIENAHENHNMVLEIINDWLKE